MRMLPLTQAQSRIWYAQKKIGDDRPFQIGGEVLLQGDVSLPRLCAAIRRLVRENEGLRLQFCEREEGVMQFVADAEAVVESMDFSQSSDPMEEYRVWARMQLQIPFVLVDAPLHAFTVFRLTPGRTGYFIRLHHLVADGWSVELITRRIAEIYEALPVEKESAGKKPPSYAEYLASEEKLLQTETMELHRKFWIDRLTPVPDLPAGVGESAGEARRESFVLTPSQAELLHHTAHEWNLSVNALWFGLCCLHRCKRYGETEVVTGIPLLGRSGRWEREIIGTFTNTMPMRLPIDRSVGARAFLEQAAAELNECYRHQKAPYNQVLQRLQAGNPGLDALYDWCVNCYNTTPAVSLGGMTAVNTEYFSGRQVYALQTILRRWNRSRLQVDYDYRLDRFTREEIQTMHRQLFWMLEQIDAEPGRPVGALCLLDQGEFNRTVHEWNRTAASFPAQETVLDAMERSVSRTPERIALSLGREEWSYHTLWRQIGRYTAWFKQNGVRPGMTVGVLVSHTPEWVAAMLAVLWCGAVLQPLDPSHPAARIDELLALSGAQRLVAPRRRTEKIPVIALEETPQDIPTPAPHRANPQAAAYQMTTSGSTGTPKGVIVGHRSLMNYLHWAQGQYVGRDREVFALYSSFAFDFTLTSLFLPLLGGHEIRLFSHHRQKNVFWDMFREGRVTVLKVTPSHFPLLHDALPAPPSLHTLVVGGENLPGHRCAALADALGREVRLFNEYGPTEATIGCMIHQFRPEDGKRDFVPLGRPIANARVYLLDGDGLPVPDGVPGELVVGGECLAVGYAEKEGDAARRFCPDPFAPGRVYHTGDLAQREAGGDIVMLGRRDEEIKLRGHRINLMEIERCIERSGLVETARVALRPNGASGNGLCAYLVGGDERTAQRVQRHCASHLPGYLVPQHFLVVEHIPLTSNGKTDWAGLPLPAASPGEKPVRAQTTQNCELLLPVLREVLEEEAGAQDNFYALGGDSIKAIQISSRLAERGISLSVGDILRNPIVSNMALRMGVSSPDEERPEDVAGIVPPTPASRWFFAQNFAAPGQYNQSMLLRFRRPVVPARLCKALELLIGHHDALRLNLNRKRELYYNDAHCVSLPPLEEATLGSIEETAKLEYCFDLEKDLLVKPRLLHVGGDDFLFLTLHHLVTDGVSWRILLDDLALLLSQQDRGESVRLAPKSDSYRRFALGLPAQARTNVPAADGGFLRADALMAHVTASRRLTGELVGRQGPSGEGGMQGILLCALYRAMARLGAGPELVVELEGHGRDLVPQACVERTVGWFTRFRLLRLSPWQEAATAHGAMPRMREIPGADTSVPAGRRIRFNYLGQLGMQNKDWFEPLPSVWPGDVGGSNRMACRLCVDLMLTRGCLEVYFTFDAGDTLGARLPDVFLKALEEGTKEPFSADR